MTIATAIGSGKNDAWYTFSCRNQSAPASARPISRPTSGNQTRLAPRSRGSASARRRRRTIVRNSRARRKVVSARRGMALVVHCGRLGRAADAGLGEGGHLVEQARGGVEQGQREQGAGALSKAQAQVQ